MLPCSIAAGSLGEAVLWSHSRNNWRISNFCRRLKKIPPPSCLHDKNDLKFPWKGGAVSHRQKTQRICFHYPMLQQIFQLFAAGHSRAHGTAPSSASCSGAWSQPRTPGSDGSPCLGILVPAWEFLSGSLCKGSITTTKSRNTAPGPGRLSESELKNALPSGNNLQRKV